MNIQLPDSLTTIPVLAGAGAVLLAVLVGVILVVVNRRRAARRERDSRPPLPAEFWLHPVGPGVARQLQARWDALQRDFVDAPSDTLRRADALVAEAMRERGYPAVDAEGRAALLREHEPAHAEPYDRLRLALAEGEDKWSTEQRRQALLQVRTLFDALLRDEDRQPRLFAA